MFPGENRGENPRPTASATEHFEPVRSTPIANTTNKHAGLLRFRDRQPLASQAS